MKDSFQNNREMKLRGLDHIFHVYETLVVPKGTVCKKGCARCCTRNVTLTGLEAVKIAEYIQAWAKSELYERLRAASGLNRFRPLYTTNQIAEICMQGRDFPEEEIDPSWSPCPLLENAECTIYPVRPFGCRCMLSMRNCEENDYAEMDEFTATANDVFLQYIEHIDVDGCFGNITDMLLFLEDGENIRNYPARVREHLPQYLISNQPMKGLMVPPEYREKIRPVLQALTSIP